MPSVKDVLGALEKIASPKWAFEFDKVGLQIGSQVSSVKKAVISLDASDGAADLCSTLGANLLISHHPLIWDPLTGLTGSTRTERIASRLISSEIAFIACHTNWDCAPNGLNDTLCESIGLTADAEFGDSREQTQATLFCYVPPSKAELIAQSIFEAGGGVVGSYEDCEWRSLGTGSFKPMEGSKPYKGTKGKREIIEEVKLEIRVDPTNIRRVEEALLKAHPYEKPVYGFVETKEPGPRIGRVGTLPLPLRLSDFVSLVEARLATKALAWGSEKLVSSVAVIGGAGDSEWEAAMGAGADAFVTGEVAQHYALAASEAGFPIICAGHFATEQPGVRKLAGELKTLLPNIEWTVFEPKPGEHGRPHQ